MELDGFIGAGMKTRDQMQCERQRWSAKRKQMKRAQRIGSNVSLLLSTNEIITYASEMLKMAIVI